MEVSWTKNLDRLNPYLSGSSEEYGICSRTIGKGINSITQYAVIKLNQNKANHGISLIQRNHYKQIENELKKDHVDFFQAIHKRDFKQADKFIRAGVDVNAMSFDGITPLIEAIHQKNLGLVKTLLMSGAHINKPDKQGMTPLMHSIKLGDIHITKLLIGLNTDLNQENESRTALSYAMAKKDLRIIKLLIRAGFDINKKNINLSTPFLDAISNPPKKTPKDTHELDEIVRYLIEYADLDVRDKDDNTALMLAIPTGNFDIIKLLASEKLDLNKQNRNGETPLSIAVSNIDELTARFLISGGAEPDILNTAGHTMLSLAALKNESNKIEFLVNLGADPNKPNKTGDTPLILAVNHGSSKAVKALIEHGVNIHCADKNGNTPIMLAAAAGHLKIVAALIKTGSFIDEVNKEGYTPLLYAKIFNHPQVADLLIEHGADNNYAEELLNRKMLAHTMGITSDHLAHTSLIHHSTGLVDVKLTPLSIQYVIKRTLKGLFKFLDSHQATKEIDSLQKSVIEDAFTNAWPIKKLTQEEIRLRIDQNIPTLFFLPASEGSPEIAAILTGNQLILCNRQAISGKDTTEIYNLPPKNIKLFISILTSQQLAMNKLHLVFSALFKKIKLASIKLKEIAPTLTKNKVTLSDVESKIKEGFLHRSDAESYSQKRHGAENRPVTLQKTVFLAILSTLGIKNSDIIYKEYTLYQRIKEIVQYIKSTPIDQQDHRLVKKSLLKLKRKLSSSYIMKQKIKGDPKQTQAILTLIGKAPLYGINLLPSNL